MRKFELIRTGKEYKLPVRSTMNSAGYDFFAPNDVSISPGETVIIYSGVRVIMEPDEVLMIYSRSSSGIKRNVSLPNSVGVIDSDYYGNLDNGGEILIALHNYGDKTQFFSRGDKLVQGIFVKFLTTIDDNAIGERTGGLGSTTA